jgi:hypothetical protein
VRDAALDAIVQRSFTSAKTIGVLLVINKANNESFRRFGGW